jgi:hypothetical protein
MNKDTQDSEDAPYYGDLSKTSILDDLFGMPADQRDEKWTAKFLENVVDASFSSGTPQVIEGPDGFPYFQLNIPEAGKQFQCYVIRNLKNDFLLEHGFGVAINPAKGQPDWIFSHGDIVNLHIRNEFYTTSTEWNSPEHDTIKEEEKVLVGQPSESVMPSQTRTVIREFLKSLGIDDCKVLLMHRAKSQSQQLVFNVTPDKFEKKEHFEAVMKCIGWYLPRHYSYVSMDESAFEGSFQAL